MGEKAFLTSKELADRWRLSDQTLANWRYAGKGPPFMKIGSKVLYPIQGINSYEQGQCLTQQSQDTSAEIRS